jgi:predicted GNAT family N-acyltransferase
MPQALPPRIVLGTWDRLRDDAYGVRHEVFVLEQAVPADIELDDMDAVSVHAVAYGANGEPLGTGRLLPDGHIGRMAVRRAARGLGVGGLILDALIEEGRGLAHRKLALHAQTHAQGFYEAHGFQAEGETFEEAGIDHVLMVRDL